MFAMCRGLGQVHLESLYFLTHWSAFVRKIKKVKLPLPSCSSKALCHPFLLFFPSCTLLLIWSALPSLSWSIIVTLVFTSLFLFYFCLMQYHISPSYNQMHLSKFKSEQFGSLKKMLFFFGFLFFTGWNWLVQHKHIYHWISICFSDAFQTNLTVHALLFYYRKTCLSLNTLLVTPVLREQTDSVSGKL